MLKTTARMLPGFIAVALGASLLRVSAEPLAGGPIATPDQAGVGPDALRAGERFPTADPQRQRADDLFGRGRETPAGVSAPAPLASGDAKSQAKQCLLRARQELANRDLQAANFWYRESLKYQAVFALGEDSPEKLAADIRRVSGPIDDATRSGGPAARVGVLPLPPTDPAGPISPGPDRRAAAPGGLAAAPQDDPGRTEAGQMLLGARRALALGDVALAKIRVQQARARNVQFNPNTDDTPDRVEALINRYNELKAQKTDRGNTDSWRHDYARMLMEQADGLLRWRDLDEAERLAGWAQRPRAQFILTTSGPRRCWSTLRPCAANREAAAWCRPKR